MSVRMSVTNLGLICGMLMAISDACSASGSEEGGRGGSYVFSIMLGEPDTYDCHATNNIATLFRLAPHYSLLLKYDPSNYPKIIGDVADKWEISNDGKDYTFHLKSGIRFHDGTELTSEDVKASYERMRQPPDGVVSFRQNYFRDIERIDVIDKLNLVFRLSKPNAAMLEIFAAPFNCIYSSAKIAADPRFPARNIMGSGPFRFVRHDAGAEWHAKRFDGYFQSNTPKLESLRILNMAPPAAINALSAGQIHAAFPGQAVTEVGRVVSAQGDKVKVYDPVTTTVMFGVTFNSTHPPFNDVRVRRALHLAIDRRGGAVALSKMITASGFGTFMRHGSAYARTDEQVKAMPGFSADMVAARAEAKKLLAEAGVPNLKFQLLNWKQYTALGVFLIDQWRQIGVAVEQELPEAQSYFERQRTGNFDVTLDGIAEFTDDPTLRFAKLVSFSKNPTNLSRSDDPQFDNLYDQQAYTADPAIRLKLVHQLEDRLLEQAFMVPLFWSKRYLVMSANVQGAATPLIPSNYVGLDQAQVWLKP